VSPRGRRGGGERSEDDRQRARLEREQRRAQREGRPVPRTIDDLPVGEPGITPSDVGRPAFPEGDAPAPDVPAARVEQPAADPPAADGALWHRATPGTGGTSATPGPVDPPAAPRAPDAQRPAAQRPDPAGRPPATQPDPEGRPPAERRDPAARRPAEPQRPAAPLDPAAARTDAADRPTPSAPSPAPATGQPWWATGEQAAPPPPAAPPSAPARPAAPRPRDDRTTPPAAPRTPAADAPTAPGRGPARPADDRLRDSADDRLRDPADDRPRGRAADQFRAPGAAAAGAAASGAAARGSAAPGGSGRNVDDWFGPDQTGDHSRDERTGEHRSAQEPERAESLVPLRPAGPARTTGTVPATVHTRTAPARRGVSRIAAVVVLVPLILIVVAAVFLFEPFKGEGEGEVRVRIQPGSSVDEIGKLLKERGVVSNSLAFAIRARISGDGANLKAGTLRLKRGMSYGAALTALQQDPLPPSVIRVSVPEGLSRSEVASTIRKAGVSGSYLTASARSAGFDPQDFGQPRARRGLEGFLFPATYELQRGGATSKALVAEQLKSFRTNIAKVSMTRARREKLSTYEILIIASMIEREVRIPSERRLVSAVIWNRLEQDIALGIDATTRYAVKNWSRPLKQSEIDRDTPYDTRRRKGLPPTPIGSPGLASIRAAANPARNSYLYYVVRPCGNGRHNFATTSAEFEKDRQAYNAAQRRADGDPSPSDAKGC